MLYHYFCAVRSHSFIMNKTLYKLFFVLFCGFFGSPSDQYIVESSENVNYDYYDNFFENDTISEVHALLYKTAKKFYCSYQDIENSELIIYGTRSWAFPKQNVNLTLSYPTKEQLSSSFREEPYMITGFKVVLFADAEESQGFITSGGLLQESIGLTFVCSDLTILVYEFWLYGIPKNTTSFMEANAASGMMEVNDICSPTIKLRQDINN